MSEHVTAFGRAATVKRVGDGPRGRLRKMSYSSMQKYYATPAPKRHAQSFAAGYRKIKGKSSSNVNARQVQHFAGAPPKQTRTPPKRAIHRVVSAKLLVHRQNILSPPVSPTPLLKLPNQPQTHRPPQPLQTPKHTPNRNHHRNTNHPIQHRTIVLHPLPRSRNNSRLIRDPETRPTK